MHWGEGFNFCQNKVEKDMGWNPWFDSLQNQNSDFKTDTRGGMIETQFPATESSLLNGRQI